MKLIYSALMGMALASPQDDHASNHDAGDHISVTCNDDNTISVGVYFDRPAEILFLKYGNCGKESDGARGTDDQSEEGWFSLTFEVTKCGMDGNLRKLEYLHQAEIRIGQTTNSQELTFAHYHIDTFCEFENEYTVKFDYGTLQAQEHDHMSAGGLVGLDFTFKTYEDGSYSEEAEASKTAGDAIYLGLILENSGFDHVDNILVPSSGKLIALKSCQVSELVDGMVKLNGNDPLTYTLFDTAESCENDAIDLAVGYMDGNHMWTMEHTLFLLSNEEISSSTYELSCQVLVCDHSEPAGCNVAIDQCLRRDE